MRIREKEVKFTTIICAIIAAVVSYLIIIGVLIYGFGMDNIATKKTSQIFPYPAAIVGYSDYISLSDLENDLNSVKMFYENQDFSDVGLRIDFSTEEGKKRLLIKERNLLTKMIENKIIEKLANKEGIKLTDEIVSQAVSREIEQYGDREETINKLKKLYGWTIEDFQEKIVKPDMYREALEKKIKETENGSEEAKKKIGKAYEELKNKKDFAELARNYSDGKSAENGGEMGWFSAEQMLPEIAMVAFSLEAGGQSDIIRSSLGYHIVQVEDKKTENGLEKIRVRQIFIKTRNFSEWLLEQEKNIKIYAPLRDLYWDKESGEVRFEDDSLRKFEEDLNKNSFGDASVMF